MLKQDFLHQLSQKAAELFPAAADARKELEEELHALMQKSFAKLNLLTREEFEAQTAVLKRAETTILALEEKVAKLEKAAAGAESAD